MVNSAPQANKRTGIGWRWLALALICGMFSAGGYWVGVLHGTDNKVARLSQVEVERDQLEASAIEMRKQYQAARQQQISLERGRAIDEQALNQARQSIVALETRNAQLRSDLGFYKKIMAPASVAKGLQIDRLSIDKNPEGGFDFRLVLTQLGNNKLYQSGAVAVVLVGQSGNGTEVIPLRDVSPQIDDLGIKYRFRYFQDIHGSFTLPSEFVPLEVQVVAQPKGKDTGSAERTFLWSKLVSN
ncbi:MAG TPA: DUF6776 family protein [Marinobacter sp.]|nr:DUF6776 family protein [Marinobacter sp.]